jgi:phosphoesterase RecJ-like protein
MTAETILAIRDLLKRARRILITSHIRPDGDAVGGVLALGLALQERGQEVQMVLNDGVPATFRHLPGSDRVQTAPSGKYDLYLTLDCADLRRVGAALETCGQPDINIDHHITNQKFGRINLIEPEAVATSSILARYLKQWELPLTKAVAANLVTGIVTDTLGFRTPNTTPEALRQVADLMELGVNMPELYYRGLISRTFPAARYWGAGLASLQRDDGLVWATLRLADRQIAGYNGNDDADLINVIASIDDCRIKMIFVEQENGTVKVSWRTQEADLDVSQIAQQFNGGGHPGAAGADVPGTLEDVQARVLAATRRALSHQ